MTARETSIIKPKVKIKVFGIGGGLLLFIPRFCKKTPAEWCSFAILLMNVVSPLIERVTGRKSFGEVKKNG